MRKLAQITTLLLIFTIPWETAITFSAVGTLTRLVGVCAAGFWVLSVLFQGRLRKLRFFHIVVLCFLLYNISSIFWTIHYDLTIERVNTYAQLAILTWIFWDLFDTPGSLRSAMQVFVLGGYLAVASAIINFISGQIISKYDFGRYSGAGQNAVEFAMILSLCLPFAWHLATIQMDGFGSNILRIVNFTFIPAALFAIILTASRTALLTIVPGLLFIVITASKVKLVYRVLVFVLFTSAIFFGQFIIPQVTLDRLGTIGQSITSNDLGGRSALWNESFKVFTSNPLLGIGSQSLDAPDQLGTFAHNTFLSILAELGILGFIQFILILGIVLYEVFNLPKVYLLFCLTVFVILIISFFSLTWEYAKSTWFILNLIIIFATIYNKQDIPVLNSRISNNLIPGPYVHSN